VVTSNAIELLFKSSGWRILREATGRRTIERANERANERAREEVRKRKRKDANGRNYREKIGREPSR